MTSPTPVHRYKLTIVIYGNTLDEVDNELHLTAQAFYPLDVCHDGTPRHELHVVGGRSVRDLQQTNPEQTPERYEQELRDWSAARGFVKRAQA